jgi:carbonic anhydrase
MTRLLPVRTHADILPSWRGTPVADLLRFHNLGEPLPGYASATLVIGMCMDNRKSLRLPDNFAYVLRAGGANFRRAEFKLSFAIAVGGARAIALIGHDQCGMVGLHTRRDAFIEGLIRHAGWGREEAELHFEQWAPFFEVGDAAAFVASEADRLQRRYPKVPVAPLMYLIGDGLLHQIAPVDRGEQTGEFAG